MWKFERNIETIFGEYQGLVEFLFLISLRGKGFMQNDIGRLLKLIVYLWETTDQSAVTLNEDQRTEWVLAEYQ